MTRIPKKIHWCWLSGDPLPPIVQDCIKSWKRKMPDYELILWDVNRFDIHSVPFVEQACAARKWACASDYIRWYALYTEGGIYLDSDVKVFRRFDKFLNHRVFFSTIRYNQAMPGERLGEQNWIEAECLGAEEGHPLMKRCMEVYENAAFQMINNVVTVGIAPVVLSNACAAFGWINNKNIDKPLHLDEGIIVYPEKYFSSVLQGKLSVFHTYAIHIGTCSWCNKADCKNDILLPLRRWHSKMIFDYWWFKYLHIKRKKLQKRFWGLFKK